MNKKKAMTFLLVSVMAGSMLAGCGSDASSAQGSSSKSAESSNNDSYTVKILAPGDASTDDCAKISEAASKITEEKFNTKIEVTRVGFGSYDQQVNLTLASSEKLDLMYEYCGNVTSAISSGQILPITDYLDSYGSDMKSEISESDWKCVTFNGNIYGVPSNKEKATGWGFAMNKEMADATGIDYSSIKTEEELEPLLEKVKEMYPDVYPIVSHVGSMSLMANSDDLGGDIGSLESVSSDSTEVINYYATDKYMNEMKLRYDWAQKGLIMPDASTSTEMANILINGLEGTHYEFTDKDNGVINYPDGVTASNTGYTSLPWAWPNEAISYVWEGNDPDIWDQTQEFNNNAVVSPAKGFAWDNTDVQNEVTACANVTAKYGPALECGSLDPETTIPKFLDELKAAGADTIIAEKQRQLDDWLEANK